jgi:hypothetical protein
MRPFITWLGATRSRCAHRLPPIWFSIRTLPAGRFQGFDSDDVIYLLMPDRFANGDPANDEPAVSKGIVDRSKGRRYHGGDLAGVRQRLPYLKDLGVTAIWMNDLRQRNILDRGKSPRDRYGPAHAIGAAPSKALRRPGQLKRDGRSALARHLDAWTWWLQQCLPSVGGRHADPNLVQRHVRAACGCHKPGRRGRARHHHADLDGWFIDILPDLNQNDPEVARYLIQNTLWWIGVAGIDGIRQDTWPYVPREFWRDWMEAIHREYPTVNVVGEVLDGDPALVSFFQGGRAQFDGIDDEVESLFDFPLSTR